MTDCEVPTSAGREDSLEMNSEEMIGIPLYLIPRAIADQIRKKRETIAYIEVRQGAGHFFTITVKTSESRMLQRKCAQGQADANGSDTSV